MPELPAVLRIRVPSGQTLRVSPKPIDSIEISFIESSVAKEITSSFGDGTWSAGALDDAEIPHDARLSDFKTGDILYFKPVNSKTEPTSTCRMSSLDKALSSLDGKIKRNKDPLLCFHPDNAMCTHCSPLDAFDAQYHASKGIKHLSYWAYVKSINQPGTGFIIPPVPLIQTGNCPTGRHAPYPKGMCSACQPSPVTLQIQKFRMVDHVEFINASAVDNFISSWRRSLNQSMAWLIGRYESYSGVPLGIKGVVYDLWMPLQESAPDGIELPIIDSPYFKSLESLLEKTLSWLGLEKIGAIWTDLSPSDSKGNVKQIRGTNTYFITGWETIWMAERQLETPISGANSPLVSRWISVVVTGDENEKIALFAYQLSLQATGLAKSKILAATSDAPYCAIWSASSQRPLPDVFYRKNIEDGSNASEQCKANPCFPTEYLLVSLTHGFPEQTITQTQREKFNIGSAYIRSNGDLNSDSFLKAISPFLTSFSDLNILMDSIHSDLSIVYILH